jgi:hypothetical protein
MAEVLKWSSVLFGLVAAVLWFASACVRIPTVYRAEGVYLVPDRPGEKQQLEPYVRPLRRQSRWNAAGAVCAAIAVGLDALAKGWFIA